VSPGSQAGAGPTARPRILIVDDQPANVQVLASVLSDEHDVFFAVSGEKALALFDDCRPDLVLLDVVMPGMDGFEVCRRLKERPHGASVPVIFVTARGEVEDETRGFEAGGVDYIPKPVNPPVVMARVRTQLELFTARERLRRQNAVLAENLELKDQVDRISRHDLRTPLTGILGAVQLLLDGGGFGPDQQELLHIIERAGFRLLNMINLSLGLFHMEKGTYALQATRVDVREVVQRVVQDLTRQAKMKDVAFDVVRADGAADAPLPALGEEILTYAVLGNLGKNAVEAAPRGSRVTFRLAGGPSEVTVSIHNQGAVPAAVRERFFEKYSSAGKVGGSGLGTYSARLMVLAQGGRISMQTSDEAGTTLDVALPAVPVEAEPPATAPAERPCAP
jgi:two-component system sensor histidine kinase/response regulator